MGIVGPIGAGKSSLLDAIAFALYGRTSRAGRDTRSLIHQRADDVAVSLRFEVDGQVWEAVRNLRRKGQAQHALYRYERDESGLAPIERITQERTVGERVERLLGLDYTAFSRSVMLAQGEFDLFLRAQPAERDRVLKGLFGLERVDRMRELAKDRERAGRHELEKIAIRLTQVEAAEAGLSVKRRRLAELEDRIALFEKMEPELVDLEQRVAGEEARRAAAGQRLAELQRLSQRLPDPARARATMQKEKDARSVRESRAEQLATAHSAAAEAEARLKAPEYAEGRRVIDRADQLMGALAATQRLVTTAGQRKEAARRRRDETEHRVSQAEERRMAAERALGEAAAEEEARRVALDQAMEADHQARHSNMAAALRSGLAAGEPCPVCSQPVKRLPAAVVPPDLKRAEELVAACRAASDRAGKALTLATRDQATALQELTEAGRRLDELEAELAVATLELGLAKGELGTVEAEFEVLLGAGDRESLIAARRQALEEVAFEVESKRAVVDEARDGLDRAIFGEQEAMKEVGDLRAEVAAVEARLGIEEELADLSRAVDRVLGEWAAQVDSARQEAEAAAVEVDRARARIAEILAELGVDEGFTQAMADLRAEAHLLSGEVSAAEAVVASGRDQIQLREKLEAEVGLHSRLVVDLSDSRFVRYLLDGERTRLAGLGSDHFQRLSSGRYRFTEDGEFMVVDLTTADAVRRADSLSGGETFLASLSLALALAEMVGREGGRLDAFFLDEGFGTLDSEHLDLAMEGIEALVSGDRLVVVVSHVPEIRQRIDDLIVLDRSPLTGDSRVISGA